MRTLLLFLLLLRLVLAIPLQKGPAAGFDVLQGRLTSASAAHLAEAGGDTPLASP